MSVQEQVKQADNPQHALLVIARALDVIITRLDDAVTEAPAQDGWGSWSAPSDPEPEQEDNSAAIKALREALAEESDADERRALEAKLRLLLDSGQSVALGMEESPRAEIKMDGEKSVVELPLPTEEQLEMREAFLDTVAPNDPDYWGEELIDAYKRGGPLLIYYSDREYVMGLPPELRKRMVEDVEISSPAEAHEMGRDVLMVRDSEDLPKPPQIS